MHTRSVRHAALPLITLMAIVVTSVATPAQALSVDRKAAVDAARTSGYATGVFPIVDRVAGQLARSLQDRAVQDRIVSSVANGPVDLMSVRAGSSLTQAVRGANQELLTAKGLPPTGASMLRLRLAHPDMRAALLRGEAPLVAATHSDDAVTGVLAYEPGGATVHLDAVLLPQRPVLLVEVDTAQALTMGLDVLRATLAQRGIAGVGTGLTATAGYWATKVNAVRLSDDKEPWIKGAAEIFNVVGGFGLDGKVKIDTVQMPYLDYDGTTYFPNQLLVHFSAYKYNLADVVMMEDDGDTNYLQLAQAIAAALLYIVDGGAYTPLVSAILAAMPNSWWTDDPDYVDSWYALSTRSSGRLNGAAANGWMDVVPYWVEQF